MIPQRHAFRKMEICIAENSQTVSIQPKVFRYKKNRIFPKKSGFSENFTPENLWSLTYPGFERRDKQCFVKIKLTDTVFVTFVPSLCPLWLTSVTINFRRYAVDRINSEGFQNIRVSDRI